MVVGPWLYHVSSTLSTPPQRSWGLLFHRRDNCLQINHKKCKILCYEHTGSHEAAKSHTRTQVVCRFDPQARLPRL